MSDSTSLVFYIVTFLVSTIFVYLGNRERTARLTLVIGRRRITINPSLIFGVTIPVLVAGLRQGVGTDFNSYVAEYNAAIQGGSYLEASFNIISSVSDTLFGSPTFMFIVFSAMTVVPVMMGLNRSTAIRREYRWLFWLLFLFVMFPQTLNMLRQGVAVAIGFYLIISVIESRKLIKFSHLAYLLLAVSFHASAWILIPLIVVAHLLNDNKARWLIAAIVITTAAYLVFFSALSQLLGWLGLGSSYLEIDTVSRSVVPRTLLLAFILAVCWKFYSVLKLANSYAVLLFIGLLFSVGGLFVAYFERAGYYITLILPLLTLVAIAQTVTRKQVGAINMSICIFALVYFVVIYYLMGSSEIFPYNSIWTMV